MTNSPAHFSDSDFTILEVLVDRYSISIVTAALSKICLRRAERVRLTFQDRLTEREWRQNAALLMKVMLNLRD